MNTTPTTPQALDAAAREQIDLAIAQYQSQPGPLLQVLHAIQDRLSYVPDAAIPLIAAALNLSRAEVHGVVTFYHHFRRRPPGKHVVQICQAESCKSMNSDALTQHAQAKLGVELHETTADARITLEPVYCLGNCACSPAIMIDGNLHGRVTPERFDRLVDALEKNR